MTTPTCQTEKGRLLKPCDGLEQWSLRNNNKGQGLYLGSKTNMTTNVTRLAVWLRFGSKTNVSANYCPYCGAMINPIEYANQHGVDILPDLKDGDSYS